MGNTKKVAEAIRLLENTELTNIEIHRLTGLPYSQVNYLATQYRSWWERRRIAEAGRKRRRKAENFKRHPQEVYNLYYRQGMTYADIARHYGISQKRAREIVLQAKRFLEQQKEETLHE